MDAIFPITRKNNELITISSTKFVIGCFQLLSLDKILLYENHDSNETQSLAVLLHVSVLQNYNREILLNFSFGKRVNKREKGRFFQFVQKYKFKLLCNTVLTWATYGVIMAPTRDIQAHVPKPTDRTIVGYTYNSTKQPVKAFSNQAYYATMSLSGGGCPGCPGASTFSKASP